MISLKGLHIIVVGGSRGIGAACARMCAEAGANVSITYRSDEKAANEVIKSIEALGGKGFAIQADISSEKDMQKAIDRAVMTFGVPNGVVISAAIYQEPVNFEDMSLEHWEKVIRTNVTGTFIASKEVIKHVKKAGIPASIVIITSTAGQGGEFFKAAYGTSKGAQIIFTKSIARELGPQGIRVNCVAPAWTETDMITDTIKDRGLENMINQFPLRKLGQPEDVAGGVLYLLSDLSNHVTGTTLVVDGGASMR